MIAHISEDGCNRIQTVVEHTEGTKDTHCQYCKAVRYIS